MIRVPNVLRMAVCCPVCILEHKKTGSRVTHIHTFMSNRWQNGTPNVDQRLSTAKGKHNHVPTHPLSFPSSLLEQSLSPKDIALLGLWLKELQLAVATTSTIKNYSSLSWNILHCILEEWGGLIHLSKHWPKYSQPAVLLSSSTCWSNRYGTQLETLGAHSEVV